MNISNFKELTDALSRVRWWEKEGLGNNWDIARNLEKGNAIEFRSVTSRNKNLGLCVIVNINHYWSSTKKGRKKDYHWYEYTLLSPNYPDERFYLEAEFDDEMILTLSEKMPRGLKVKFQRESPDYVRIEDYDYYLDEKEWVIMRDEKGKETLFFVEDFVLDKDDSQGLSIEYWDNESELLFTESVRGHDLTIYR